MKALLNRVLNNDLCSGCGMCSSVADDDAIKIRLTGDGYHRPVLNAQYQNKPVANEQTSAAFAKSCPALNLD
ncbi:MAG TPA: coenzyme F420 hydrogenase, partial [Pseudomonas sp.]|nr:coenzyme F420 hydrogenase [Pseudomonas sp.]